jgi:DNA-binding LacI/PurR family transcriptional regulator
MAYILYNIARELKIRIPHDISLVGYDDLPWYNTHPLALTTIHQPIYEMGQECMRLLLKRLRGDRGECQKIELKSHLMERDSVLPLQAP